MTFKFPVKLYHEMPPKFYKNVSPFETCSRGFVWMSFVSLSFNFKNPEIPAQSKTKKKPKEVVRYKSHLTITSVLNIPHWFSQAVNILFP